MKCVLFSLFLSQVSSHQSAPWQATGATLGSQHYVQPIFMLKHDKAAVSRLEQFVAEVSSPSHSNYGKYLSMDDLRATLPPVTGAKEAVLKFLSGHGISETSISASGDMLSVRIPVAKAAEIFQADFGEYSNQKSNHTIIRASGGYSLPTYLQEFLYMVGNLKELTPIRGVIHVPGGELEGWFSTFGTDCSGCRNKVTPQVLADAYRLNLSSMPEVSKQDTGMATAEFSTEDYDTGSLNHFQYECSLPFDVKVDNQIGANKPSHCLAGNICTEALLDIQYIKAMGGSIPLTNVWTQEYSLLDWAKTVDGLGDAGPAVHSISYGDDEIQQSDDAPDGMSGGEYMEAVNVQFAKLAARGISIVVASGDQGVWGRSGGGDTFHPDFPSSSPYVTAVGGTDFLVRSQVGEEKAWQSSGGGFSNHFERPAWQKTAVASYLSSSAGGTGLPAAGRFNSGGRAYPDVATLGGEGNPFCVAEKMFPGIIETMTGVAGTSASTPVFAGLVARLNAARIAKGMPRMGFLNPWIYENAPAFNDVVHGTNDDGRGEGFNAAPGWDPATGVGTPRFDAMLAAAMESRRRWSATVVV